MVYAGGGYEGRAIPVRHAPFPSVSIQDVCTAEPQAARGSESKVRFCPSAPGFEITSIEAKILASVLP